MADGVLISRPTVRKLAEVTRRVLGNRAGVDPNTHRKPWDDDGTDDGEGGSGGSSGCCCNEADCIDLCGAIDSDVILGCAACPNGALKVYRTSIGKSAAFSEFSDNDLGVTQFGWFAGCLWKTGTFTVGDGDYETVLILGDPDVGVPYFEVQHLSGGDPLKVTDGFHRYRWTYTGTNASYSCLCNMQFRLDVNHAYKPKGLNHLICLLPFPLGERPLTCPKVINPETEEFVVPCLEYFTFPNLDLSELCGFSGSTAVVVPLQYTIDAERQCAKVGTTYLVPPSHPPDNSDAIYVTADIWYAGETVVLSLHCPLAGGTAEYTSVGEWVIGENVLTISAPSTLFPTNITVTLSDCVFGSTHPDLGYGCGGTGGGAGCDWTGVANQDGTFSWYVPSGQYMACGGGCPFPPMDPTLGATYHTDCYEDTE